jgi:hypothetical protein
LQYVERIADMSARTGAGYQASRILEGALIGFATSLPENAIGLAKLERENGQWHLADDFHVQRVPVAAVRS